MDYFSSRPHSPYDEAETLDDVRDGLRVVHTFLKMGRYQQAYAAYSGPLADALHIILEAYAEQLSLVRPFFPQGWTTLPNAVDEGGGLYLAHLAAIALAAVDAQVESQAAFGAALAGSVRRANWPEVCTCLPNMSRRSAPLTAWRKKNAVL